MFMVAILAAVCWLAWTYMVRPRLSEVPDAAVNHVAAASSDTAKDGPR
jgi:hypothetical protein